MHAHELVYSCTHTLSKGDWVSEANKLNYGDYQSEGKSKSKREREVKKEKETKNARERERTALCVFKAIPEPWNTHRQVL